MMLHGVVFAKQSGQYHGAGVLTGLGLLLRQLAQRNRLPLTAVFGRVLLPVLRKFLAIGVSGSFLVRFAHRSHQAQDLLLHLGGGQIHSLAMTR